MVDGAQHGADGEPGSKAAAERSSCAGAALNVVRARLHIFGRGAADFILTPGFQCATQLTVGLIPVALFVLVPAMRFYQSCLSATLFIECSLLGCLDNHVGTKLLGCAAVWGAVIWGAVLGGITLSLSLLAGFDDGAHTAVLCCLSAFFIAVMSVNRVGQPLPFVMLIGAMVSCLAFGLVVILGQFQPTHTHIWRQAVGSVLADAAIGAAFTVAAGLAVLPSLAADELRGRVAAALRGVGQAASRYATLAFQPERDPYLTPAASSAALAQLAAASAATAGSLAAESSGPLAKASAATDSAIISGRVHRRVLTPSKISTPFPSCASFSRLMSGSQQAASASAAAAGTGGGPGSDGSDRPSGAPHHRRTTTVNGSVMGRESDMGGVIGEEEGEAMVEVLLEDGGEELSDEAFMELLRRATAPPQAPQAAAAAASAATASPKAATPRVARVGPKWAVWRRSASAGAASDAARRQQQQHGALGGAASAYPAVAVAAAEAEAGAGEAAVGKTSAAGVSDASTTFSAEAATAAASGKAGQQDQHKEHHSHDEGATALPTSNVLLSSPPVAALRPLLARARACIINASCEPPWLLEAPFVPADWARVIAAADELLTRVAALECIVHSREGSRIVHDAALVHYFTVDIVPHFRAALSRVATSCVALSVAVEPGAAARRRRQQQQQQQQGGTKGSACAAGEGAAGDVEQGKPQPGQDKPWAAVKRDLRHVMRQAVHGYWARVRRDGETRVRIIEAHRIRGVSFLWTLTNGIIDSVEALERAVELATTSLEQREAAAAAATAKAGTAAAAAGAAATAKAGGAAAGGGWWARLRGRPGSWEWLWKLTLLFWGEFLLVNLVRVARRELPPLRTAAGRGALLRSRVFQSGVKYWLALSTVLLLILGLSERPDTPEVRHFRPLFGFVVCALSMSERVEATVSRVSLWVLGTVVGGTLGFVVMVDTHLAANPYALLTVICAFTFLVGVASSYPQLRMSMVLTLITFAGVSLCQYTGTCGAHGSPQVYGARLLSVMAGCSVPVLLSQLILPWYTSDWALQSMGRAFSAAAQLVRADYEEFWQDGLRLHTVHKGAAATADLCSRVGTPHPSYAHLSEAAEAGGGGSATGASITGAGAAGAFAAASAGAGGGSGIISKPSSKSLAAAAIGDGKGQHARHSRNLSQDDHHTDQHSHLRPHPLAPQPEITSHGPAPHPSAAAAAGSTPGNSSSIADARHPHPHAAGPHNDQHGGPGLGAPPHPPHPPPQPQDGAHKDGAHMTGGAAGAAEHRGPLGRVSAALGLGRISQPLSAPASIIIEMGRLLSAAPTDIDDALTVEQPEGFAMAAAVNVEPAAGPEAGGASFVYAGGAGAAGAAGAGAAGAAAVGASAGPLGRGSRAPGTAAAAAAAAPPRRLQELVATPLVAVQMSLVQDSVLWTRGPFATPPVVAAVLRASQALVDQLAALGLVAGAHVAVDDGGFSGWAFEHIIAPLNTELQSYFAILMEMAAAAAAHLALLTHGGGSRAQTAESAEGVLRIVERLHQQRLKVHNGILELRRRFHAGVRYAPEHDLPHLTAPDDAMRTYAFIFALAQVADKATALARLVAGHRVRYRLWQ
ncbi:hypothetical protein HXX76_011943 [Chlamydomonas incerta]|uniref:Integral membrane bound transporter domain-containing protein n=1 Tax=Chlamydomonas incerta TaxID=51695 RepID=A0A835SXZ7_CHLIN|nr:hypothetical protein HXX76_011943 [Chlamydomonas incerta]|eukprot:KAG2427956.1 hypothetical protein HXX76_011943 [Chlamydomonas incerta]